MGFGRYVLVLAAGAALGAGAGAACGDGSHIYEGRLFTEDRACLGPTTSIDVVEGDRPGDCEAKCLVDSQSDGGRAVFVSRMCGPYPYGFDVSGTDPSCDDALAALARGDNCLDDGGSTAPLPTDSGGDGLYRAR